MVEPGGGGNMFMPFQGGFTPKICEKRCFGILQCARSISFVQPLGTDRSPRSDTSNMEPSLGAGGQTALPISVIPESRHPLSFHSWFGVCSTSALDPPDDQSSCFFFSTTTPNKTWTDRGCVEAQKKKKKPAWAEIFHTVL